MAKAKAKIVENERLAEAREKAVPWKKWGPYLSERQWGTVREDYSESGDAWNYFTHDQARSRAYRWGEDGLAGISDDNQTLCFALALWNGADPILKERLFGLNNSEGNHGEDVKEYYYYLDSTPTHSYMKYLYKYPQAAFPYADLVETNRSRGKHHPEYELIDTGVFIENRYFDIFVEYAKAAPEDLLIKITVCNRGPDAATLHLLPTLWFRNTWAWSEGPDASKPQLRALDAAAGLKVIEAAHGELGTRYLYCDGDAELLFTENKTNAERCFGTPNVSPYVKDSINDRVVSGRTDAVHPGLRGTKAAALIRLEIAAGGQSEVRLRLTDIAPAAMKAPIDKHFDATFAARIAEADAFYESITPDAMPVDDALVMRQALAGMLWTKQYFYYDVAQWLKERGLDPTRDKTPMRNREWSHMHNADIISMPDKWEYPWYAAWDLAFHTIPLAMVDPDFAKGQLDLMLRETYMHPNGQIPAYEWNFGDVNPPVHAFAAWFVYLIDREVRGKGDLVFLKETFQKLLLNFTWWVNRKDAEGNNLFAGGFLGLDNIGVFDRSSPLPTGGRLEQADGTAWMAFFSAMMLQMAIDLALDDPMYESMAVKFADHYFSIAAAMDRIGDHNDELWDEEDGFFYDVLHFPDGTATRLKVRSMVGLLPLFATAVFPHQAIDKLPRFVESVHEKLARIPELTANIHPPAAEGFDNRHLFCLFSERKLRRVLAYMLDENEFLSPYGIRSLSRYYLDHPYVFHWGGQDFKVAYVPGDSDTGMFGGNSNWRGPIWMPVNVMLIKALINIYQYIGDDFKVECPTGSGNNMNMFEVAKEISNRLANIFRRDAAGRRPVFGANETFQNDPNWRDHVLFYEYFNGDTGAGIGASHQTGWTGCVAKLMQMFASIGAEDMLKELGIAQVYQEPAEGAS